MLKQRCHSFSSGADARKSDDLLAAEGVISALKKQLADNKPATASEAIVRARAAQRNDPCAICFLVAPTISTLCCGLALHVRCLSKWRQQKQSQVNSQRCPSCRHDLEERAVAEAIGDDDDDDGDDFDDDTAASGFSSVLNAVFLRTPLSESDDEGFSNIEDDDDREDDFSTDDDGSGSDGDGERSSYSDDETNSSVDEHFTRPGTVTTWGLARQARRTFENAAAQLSRLIPSQIITEQYDIDDKPSHNDDDSEVEDDSDGEMAGSTVFVTYLSETEDER